MNIFQAETLYIRQSKVHNKFHAHHEEELIQNADSNRIDGKVSPRLITHVRLFLSS